MARLSLADMHRLFPEEQNVKLMVFLSVLIALFVIVSFIVPGDGGADWAQFYRLAAGIAVLGFVSALYAGTFPNRDMLAILNMWPFSAIIVWAAAVMFFVYKMHEAAYAAGLN